MRGGEGGLQRDGRIHVPAGVLLQFLPHDGKALFLGIVSPEEEARVARVIVGGIEIPVGLIGERGNI